MKLNPLGHFILGMIFMITKSLTDKPLTIIISFNWT